MKKIKPLAQISGIFFVSSVPNSNQRKKKRKEIPIPEGRKTWQYYFTKQQLHRWRVTAEC